MPSSEASAATSYAALCKNLGVGDAGEAERRRVVKDWLRHHRATGLLAFDLQRKGFVVRKALAAESGPVPGSRPARPTERGTKQPRRRTLH
jgi:hypothetical protein